jgi:hypothetical protein
LSGQKRHQVFVSSTFRDLERERQAVLHSLMEMGCIPVGMELFPAASESQWNYITRTILECDYYLVIVGARYGTLAPDGISYTEKEYRFAVDNGKPTITFLHPHPKTLKQREKDASRISKLEAFREHYQSLLCKHWTSPETLAAAVNTSVTQLIQDKPSFGWIHGEWRAESGASLFDGWLHSESTCTELANPESRERRLWGDRVGFVVGDILTAKDNSALATGSV